MEDIKIKDSGLPYVQDKKGKVRDVCEGYKLDEGEKWSNFEEYKKSQEKEWEKLLRKSIEGGPLLIDNYIENVERFYGKQPFFYDRTGLYWFWQKDEHKYEEVDEVDVMIALDEQLGFMGQTISATIRNNYLEAFKRVGREKKPKEAPEKWVQFKDKAFSLSSSKVYDVEPNYFFTNPIPWELGESEETPTIDNIFKEWVEEEYVETLYEIIAYCCYADYPIHIVICLIGSGSNGKSKFLGLIAKFIGEKNICSSELDLLLDKQFESFKLYRKLVCTLGETNFGIIKKTSILKKLTGQDLVGFEKKGKTPFDDHNYAKILIGSNSMPSSEDTSYGFYRRWLIIDFPNVFPEGHDILKTIPEKEYNNLAKKVITILPKLLEKGMFTNQGTMEQRRERYIEVSNPLSLFIKEFCIRDETFFMRYTELYGKYIRYLNKRKRRQVSRKEFSNILIQEGLEVRRTTKIIDGEYIGGYFIEGLNLKEQKKEQKIMVEEIEETIRQKCSSCGNEPSHYWDNEKPICKDCKKAREIQN